MSVEKNYFIDSAYIDLTGVFLLSSSSNMKYAHCMEKGQRLMTFCKNKLCDESCQIFRHLNLSSTEHEHNDPAKQFTQGLSTSCFGPQCRDL